MPRTVVEKAVCENCGVDVRENTLFCYNCGSSVAEPDLGAIPENNSDSGVASDAGARLVDLTERIKIEPPTETEKRRAKAAAERKKARINPRKRQEVVWEPADDAPDRLLLLISLLIAIIAAVIVVLTILWR